VPRICCASRKFEPVHGDDFEDHRLEPGWADDGTDGRTLYVTSLRENLSAAELARTPHAGGVFMLEPGVGGAPAALYKG
jgi:hypothetical protein